MGKQLSFVGEYLKANVAMALEYKASLISQIIGMTFNDILWVAFWVLYFTRFSVIKGWTREDVLILWASFALSAGIVHGVFTNATRIPVLVTHGQLDYYLALPKNVLLHLLVSRMSVMAATDMLFGPVLLLVMVKLTWVRLAVFFVAAVLGAVVLLSFYVLVGSLAFFIGNSETVSGQLANGLLHFSSYPAPIFDGIVKMLLFTLVPAGFVTTLPVELVREFHWLPFLELLGGAAFFLTLAIWVFHRGLRRYESGNLMGMRS